MSLKIRLARRGRKKVAFYSIVVSDSRSPRDGNFIDKVGTYNPLLGRDDEKRIVLDLEKIKSWLAKGAQPTDRVAIFLGDAGLIAKPKMSTTPKKSQPKAKAVERQREKDEKAKAAAEAAASASEGEAAE